MMRLEFIESSMSMIKNDEIGVSGKLFSLYIPNSVMYKNREGRAIYFYSKKGDLLKTYFPK